MPLHRYQLSLPNDLFAGIQAIAFHHQCSTLEILRRLIKYGMLVYNIVQDPKARLIIKEGETEREIILV